MILTVSKYKKLIIKNTHFELSTTTHVKYRLIILCGVQFLGASNFKILIGMGFMLGQTVLFETLHDMQISI